MPVTFRLIASQISRPRVVYSWHRGALQAPPAAFQRIVVKTFVCTRLTNREPDHPPPSPGLSTWPHRQRSISPASSVPSSIANHQALAHITTDSSAPQRHIRNDSSVLLCISSGITGGGGDAARGLLEEVIREVEIAGHGSLQVGTLGTLGIPPSRGMQPRRRTRCRGGGARLLRRDALIGTVNSSLGSKRPRRRASRLPFLPSYLQAIGGLGRGKTNLRLLTSHFVLSLQPPPTAPSSTPVTPKSPPEDPACNLRPLVAFRQRSSESNEVDIVSLISSVSSARLLGMSLRVWQRSRRGEENWTPGFGGDAREWVAAGK